MFLSRLALISLFLAREAYSQTCQTPSLDATAFSQIAFDYIVVGGGTAGLALASKLAEDNNIQVGVIEAGSAHFNDALIDVPANMGAAVGNSHYDWAFKSIPQVGLNGFEMPIPRGKMLGGSSGLNFLAWNRGGKAEYDTWAAFGPESSWCWDGLLPYLKSCTTTRANESNPYPGIPVGESQAGSDPEFVGFEGPIQSSYNVIYADPVPLYVEALNTLGIDTNANPNDGNNAGVINSRNSLDRSLGVRSYATEYYCLSSSRSNFHVTTEALVQKIHFSGSESGFSAPVTATGIEFVAGAQSFVVNATREIVLAAGTIQTPQLLELSGIGNASLLQSLDIISLVDLPGVGENLQDHLFAGAEFQLKPGVRTFDDLRNNATFATEQAAEYNTTRTGFLAAIDSTLAFLPFHLFLNSTQIEAQLQTFDDAVTETDNPLFQLQYSLQRQMLEDPSVPQAELVLFNSGQTGAPNTSYITVLAGSLHPIARGSVHINSSSPSSSPVIDQKYLTNDFDLATIVEGLKFVLQLNDTKPLSQIIETRTVPPPNLQSDEDLTNFVRASGQSGSHPIGTAAMAPREIGGVVDGRLKVYGTRNLRVVDASIIPLLFGAHIQATVYAIGEKAADIIKEDRTD